MRKNAHKISILIPCHNEEKSIKKCVESYLNQTRKIDEIVVVNDGSTDNSLKILKGFGKKIKLINVAKTAGNKSYAQERGLKKITGDIFLTVDADTILDRNFVKRIIVNFEDSNVVAVAGYVKSLKHNWLTACRELNYVVGQRLHKTAQSYLGAIFVVSGCAGAFRTKDFKKYINFEHDSLTEDLDFTYKLHKNHLKIKYEQSAVVYTQDPADLGSYIRQMRRWYGGGWRNLAKHFRQIIHRPRNVLELVFIYGDGLAATILFFLVPIINIQAFFHLIFFQFIITGILAVYASIIDRRIDILIYFPLNILLLFINSWIFLEEFVNEIILNKRNKVWYSPERRLIT